jgi:glycerophosphoryl diester phosphodiesterase
MRGVRVVDERLVKVAHDAGLQVHVWTVNRRTEMVRLLDMGVDGLITDRPDVLKDLLVERGEWTT